MKNYVAYLKKVWENRVKLSVRFEASKYILEPFTLSEPDEHVQYVQPTPRAYLRFIELMEKAEATKDE